MTKISTSLAVITGASSGIGLAFARKLASEGYHLIITARRKERLDEIAHELQEKYGKVIEVISADLSKLEDIEMVSQKIQESKNLEILVNNAGYGLPGKFVDNDPVKQQDMLMVHNVASFQLCRSAVPIMLKNDKGTIINVASISGLMVKFGNVTYNATKSFLIVLSQSLQEELKYSNIKIQALCPGMTRSEFHNTEELKIFDKSAVPKNFWMTSETLVKKSFKALFR